MCSYTWFSCLCPAGEAQAWKIIKFHMLKHLIHHIIMFGWIENTSCQAGEHCHKFYIKLIKTLTNNKENWQEQVFRFHAKSQGVQTILAEIGITNRSCVVHALVHEIYVLYKHLYMFG